MNNKLKHFSQQIEYLEALFEEDPSKIFFILMLLLNDDPLSEDELEHLIAAIGRHFHHNHEKYKIDEMIKKIRFLRDESKINKEFENLVLGKIRTLLSNQKVLDYLRKSRQLDQKGFMGL